MAKQKITGDVELDTIINNIHKDYGVDSIIEVCKPEKTKGISTGSMLLDQATGIGGIPYDRITEIFGWEGTGKTSLAMRTLRSYQDSDDSRMAIWVNVERAPLASFLEGFGIDTSQVLMVKPKSAEQALDTLRMLVASGEIGFAVLDSVDALVTQKEMDNSLSDTDVMSLAKDMSRHMRKMASAAEEQKAAVIYLNQFREKQTMFGDPRTTSGGNALRFYASLRIEIMNRKPSKMLDNGWLMRVKLDKNRFEAPLDDHIKIHFRYARGPDPIVETMSLAKQLGYMRSASRFVYYTPEPGNKQKESRISDHGAAGASQYLVDHPKFTEQLKAAIMDFEGDICPPTLKSEIKKD